jgi:hypothetical protein
MRFILDKIQLIKNYSQIRAWLFPCDDDLSNVSKIEKCFLKGFYKFLVKQKTNVSPLVKHKKL